MTNSKVLILNMTIVFQKSSPKIPKKGMVSTKCRHFHSQITAFSLFYEIFQLDKFEGAEFKHYNIAFKLQSKTTQIKHFWYQIQAFFIFFTKLHSLSNLRVLISNMPILYSNSNPKISQIRHFLSPTLSIFIFSQNFAIRQIRGC